MTLATMTIVTSTYADVRVPSIFGGNMVLQRDQENPIWGWAEPGEKVIVKVGDQQHETTAGDDGAWRVTVQPMSVGEPRSIVIEGKNRLEFNDVLVGEVWLCSGQSNMQWSVSQSNNADLETLTANFPNIA
ncbi:MAG: hypothetical protein R3C05_31060 [Pirellulaceae bacterium]